MKLLGKGCSRAVYQIGPWAFKRPRLTEGWRGFLWGLLSNMKESDRSKHLAEGSLAAKTLLSLPLGILNVQELGGKPPSEEEWRALDLTRYPEWAAEDWKPANLAYTSRGFLLVDYG